MVSRILIRIFTVLSLMGAAFGASAQSNKGEITPVESDDDAPPKPVLHYYDKHGNRLETPVLYLAELDTVRSVRPSSPYPLYNGVTVGVNFADAILALTGQKHSSYDVSASVSLHNWFFPIVEAGIGWGKYHDNNDLYRIKAHPSFYAKVGLNYNFLYKSSPDYMAYIGLRFGLSSHTWDMTDIKAPSDTSGSEEGSGESAGETVAASIRTADNSDSQVTDLFGERCLSTYGEVVAGLKVKIAGPFSLGWSVRYRLGLHNSKGKSPWFVPGYGTGPIGVNFSAFFTFGQKKKKEPIAEVEDALDSATVPDYNHEDEEE